ncbi:hypothetical protein D3C85_1497050 [compost metagenome]
MLGHELIVRIAAARAVHVVVVVVVRLRALRQVGDHTQAAMSASLDFHAIRPGGELLEAGTGTRVADHFFACQ